MLFLNPNPKYRNEDTPHNYQDWLDLFSKSIDEDINIVLNIKNAGIAKTIQLIEFDTLDPTTLYEMKISEGKKAMISIIENEGKIEIASIGIKEGLTDELIQKLTSLSPEKIQKLRNNLNNK